MELKSIVERLKEFGQTRTDDSDWSVLDSEAGSLTRRNPFSFLIAVAFDRGIPWQKAWRIPGGPRVVPEILTGGYPCACATAA